jgi:hypothetical protein
MRSEFEKTVVLDDFDPLEYAWFDPKRNRYIPYSRDEVCLDASITLNAGWEAFQYQQSKVDELQKRVDSCQELIQKWNGGGYDIFDVFKELEQALKGGGE